MLSGQVPTCAVNFLATLPVHSRAVHFQQPRPSIPCTSTVPQLMPQNVAGIEVLRV